ncbi:uncharacterized protein RCC_06730 [Ramularia collo-cygni]|uniref:Uncharacterized protein n=1 Tax=Ramularia collo-cygni TaxID=112498 RepID=A0A2D3V605_9PEZI|nr:uncharacterized protein RCC_06730 [Ramularia collo-cygni]CZT20870.1 uncharacterized protein RCC_06730 [Ramularia collo-cygni]
MSFPKTYFLCPTSEFIHPPPTGPLCLGSILQSTSAPQYPLNRGSIVPVPNRDPDVVETDWKKTVSAETVLGMGVYAQFLQLAVGGLGPEVDVERSRRTVHRFAFDSVTTLSFEPSSQYIEETIKAPAVQEWLKEPKRRFTPGVSLFLLTGLKLVKGAKIMYSTSKGANVSGNIGINVPSLGMTFGPKGHWSSTDDDETELGRETEFVFAFRVKRLRFWRKLKVQDHTKGAFLAIGKDNPEDESVCVEEVDGSNIETARLVPDEAEVGGVYCVSP